MNKVNTPYRELIVAIEEAETICSLVDELCPEINETNVAHMHIYNVLCERATDKVSALIGAAMRYNEEMEADNED